MFLRNKLRDELTLFRKRIRALSATLNAIPVKEDPSMLDALYAEQIAEPVEVIRQKLTADWPALKRHFLSSPTALITSFGAVLTVASSDWLQALAGGMVTLSAVTLKTGCGILAERSKDRMNSPYAFVVDAARHIKTKA